VNFLKNKLHYLLVADKDVTRSLNIFTNSAKFFSRFSFVVFGISWNFTTKKKSEFNL